jgi:hypothetical protein
MEQRPDNAQYLSWAIEAQAIDDLSDVTVLAINSAATKLSAIKAIIVNAPTGRNLSLSNEQ